MYIEKARARLLNKARLQFFCRNEWLRPHKIWSPGVAKRREKRRERGRWCFRLFAARAAAAAAAGPAILTFALLDSIHAKADWVRCPLLPLCCCCCCSLFSPFLYALSLSSRCVSFALPRASSSSLSSPPHVFFFFLRYVCSTRRASLKGGPHSLARSTAEFIDYRANSFDHCSWGKLITSRVQSGRIEENGSRACLKTFLIKMISYKIHQFRSC